MKTPQSIRSFWSVLPLLALLACQHDDGVKPVKVNHTGDKWAITSVEYNIIDQNLTKPSQTVKNGTKADAGAFYFDGTQGSFDISVETYHLEDYYSSQDNGTSISLTSVAQNVGVSTVSQNVIAISGDKTTTTMSIQGTITKQSLTSQFVFTGTFTLTKQ